MTGDDIFFLLLVGLFVYGLFVQRTGYKPRDRFGEAVDEVKKIIKRNKNL